MSDAAIMGLVTGCITVAGMVIGFLTLWVKLKYNADKAEEAVVKAAVVERKIDDNTAMTHRAAATTVAVINDKLNGGIDDAIKKQIGPVQAMLEDHVAKDQNDLSELKEKMDAIAKHSNEHSHKIYNELHLTTLKLELIFIKLGIGDKL